MVRGGQGCVRGACEVGVCELATPECLPQCKARPFATELRGHECTSKPYPPCPPSPKSTRRLRSSLSRSVSRHPSTPPPYTPLDKHRLDGAVARSARSPGEPRPRPARRVGERSPRYHVARMRCVAGGQSMGFGTCRPSPSKTIAPSTPAAPHTSAPPSLAPSFEPLSWVSCESRAMVVLPPRRGFCGCSREGWSSGGRWGGVVERGW